MIKDLKDINAQYTIEHTGYFYQMWNIINIIACIFTTIMYPYYSVNHLPTPDLNNVSLWVLLVFEFICLSDMVIKFFLQELDEEG